MQGILSILDELNRNKYEKIVRDLLRDMGVRQTKKAPSPHFSYHISDNYDVAELLPMLEQMTWQMEPFLVQINGLGVFTQAEPVIYAAIVRTRQLTKLHETLWDIADRFCPAPNEYYHPSNWIPHITLLNRAELTFRMPYVMEKLSEQDFQHEVLVNNLVFMGPDGAETVFSFGQT